MIKSLYDTFKPWSGIGSVYIISDTHFGDSDCKLMNRDWPDPDTAVAKINSLVKKDDTLIILGDVGDTEYVKKIRAGYKVLITGNHDKGAERYKKNAHLEFLSASVYSAKKAYAEMKRRYPDLNIEVKEARDAYRMCIATDGLFDEVYTGPLVISDKIILSHEPIDLPFFTNIHGHLHGYLFRYQNSYGCTCLNVASDVCCYEPINLGAEINNGLLANTKTIHRITIDEQRSKND